MDFEHRVPGAQPYQIEDEDDDEYEDDFSARYEPKRRFDCLIKRMSRIASLVAVSVLLVEMLFSQQTPKLVAFDTLLANPQPYAGKTIALHCVLDKSEPANGLTLTDAQNFGATAKTQRSPLRATWMKDAAVVSVQKGQEAIVIGQIQMQDSTPIFQVANIITDKSAVRRFIRPSERRPRPGDNLGHDAQPSKSLSD
jgi:hypothetical protein